MFTSPQSVTINSVATDLHRILDDGLASTYNSADGSIEMKISSQPTKNRVRRMVRIDKTIIASDPLTAENAYQKAGVYVVIDEPTWGFSDADLVDIVNALKTWLTVTNTGYILASRH